MRTLYALIGMAEPRMTTDENAIAATAATTSPGQSAFAPNQGHVGVRRSARFGA